MEFSKILLIADYAVMLLLIMLCAAGMDLTEVAIAWVAQIGVSSGAYYWKSKNENRTKVPMMVIKNMPKSIRESLDLTEIIKEILSHE